jgi:hypothetical protein
VNARLLRPDWPCCHRVACRRSDQDPNERQLDPEMRGDANNAIQAAPELPVGAGCQEKQNLPAKGKVFLLDIPSPKTQA